MSTQFAVKRFAEIPKIVGRGAKAGSGRPSIYPFVDMKEVGDGFEFDSILAKKVRGAAQAYRSNFPQYKFVIRDLRDDEGKQTGVTACILAEVLTDEEVKAIVERKAAEKAAQKAAEAKAAATGGIPVSSNGNAQAAPQNAASAAPAPSASVDEALAGLDGLDI